MSAFSPRPKNTAREAAPQSGAKRRSMPCVSRDDGEATDGSEYETGKAERAEVCLYRECNKEIRDCGSYGEERHEFCKRNAIVEKA